MYILEILDLDSSSLWVFDFFIHYRYELVGVISSGVSCGQKNVPGVYASVPNALNFIAWDIYCKYGSEYQEYYDFFQHSDWIDKEIKALGGITGAGKYLRRAQELKNSCR